MSKRTQNQRTKAMDVLFVIDATGSMANTIQAVHDKAEDLAFELHVSNRNAAFRFGCICYRDPVDAPSDIHQWRDNSKRAIIWIADAPDHGQRYCGSPNHQEEEPKLEPLVIRLAKEKYYFVGISLNHGADQTFAEMKSIFESNYVKDPVKEIPFKIESFTPEKGNEIERIAKTMAESTKGIVEKALFE